MNLSAHAVKTTFDALASDTYKRAWAWFKRHPDEKFAYWGKDEFLPGSADDAAKADFVARHPEVEDLSDHTTCYWEDNRLVLRTFCPKLKAGIKQMYDTGVKSGKNWMLKPDGSNWEVTVI